MAAIPRRGDRRRDDGADARHDSRAARIVREFPLARPRGKVLAASSGRNYGANPYPGYDSTPRPFLYDGPLPQGVAPLARVVRVGAEAWSLALLRASGTVVAGNVRLSWTPGQNSAVDAASVAEGVDVGNVTAMRRGADGVWRDIPYSVDFAFAFAAFYPDSPIHVR